MAHNSKVTIKVNVEKINKEILYKGKKGTYLTLTLVPTPNNQYGDDYMVTQYMGKGVDDIILGNGRDLNFENADGSTPEAVELEPSSEDGLPF
jgi:hypothetical protein|tara:strand:+ start:9966 stop:10244 length:279 start_codon:yes stop_codon:yes gene_type:complete